MNPELQELLARLEDADNPLTDEELAELREKITAIASDVDPSNASDEDLEVLAEAAEKIQKVNEQIDQRAEAAAERAAKAEELRNAILPPADEETTDAEASDAPAEGDEGGDGETAAPAEENPAAPAEVPAPDNEPAPTGEAPAEPVAASTAPRVPRISRLAHRTPRTHQPVPTQTEGARKPVLVASADIPGLPVGQPVEVDQFAEAASRKIEAILKTHSSGADGEHIPFGTIQVDYPEDRVLDGDVVRNEQKIDDVAGREALVAAGGICAPVGVDYTLNGVTQAGRPVRDGMVQFGATRGGVRYVLPATLAGVSAGNPVQVWTAANDANPTSPATKPHATFKCAGVQEALVDAVPLIVQFGNFQSRYFAEQVANFLQTIEGWQARVAESTLMASMTTGSTAVTTAPNLLGTASDLLGELDRAAAAMRNRHRMAPETPLRFVFPEWLEDNIRADLARELPGNSGGQSERLAVADAEIARFFAARNINVTKYQDSPTGAAVNQNWVIQGVGSLLPWPTKAITYLYPEGSWMFLDGGELNLGMVRDSTLNATNDFQMFSETFEKAVFRGVESLQITFDICPSGQRASTVDTSSYCASGS